MTINDPSLIVSINEDLIILIGTPDDFYLKTTNPDHKNQVLYFMQHKTWVPLIPGGPSWKFASSGRTLIGIAAAMVAVNPSVAVLREAPEPLWRELAKDYF